MNYVETYYAELKEIVLLNFYSAGSVIKFVYDINIYLFFIIIRLYCDRFLYLRLTAFV
jgi:hypothetical protein